MSDADTAVLDSFLRALGSIDPKPGERILLTGEPATREVAERAVKTLAPGASIANNADGSERFDLLVHVLADAEGLQESLSALRLDGKAYVLVMPGDRVLALDLYPNIHRSSLRVMLRRVGGA
jgi:hypothetical protein